MIIMVNKFYTPILTVYMLHWIEEGPDAEFTVSQKALLRFLNHIERKNMINLNDIDDIRTTSYQDAVMISFDDVTESFWTYAYPILKKRQIPFTLFVATDYINKEGFLSSEQLQQLSDDELCTIGSHGISHQYFSCMSKETIIKELKESKVILQQLTHREIKYFAFPYGAFFSCGYHFKHHVLDYYKAGFSTIPTYITKNPLIRPYFMPRINLTEQLINKLCKNV